MFGLKVLPKLLQKKYREEYGYFLVEGKKGVADALSSTAEVDQLVMSDQFFRHETEFCGLAEVAHFIKDQKVLRVSHEVFSQLADSVTPQGIAAVVKIPEHTLSSLSAGQTLVILDDVRDPGNVGTMIRTADWFGVDGIIFAGGADPYQPKVVRASMGSLFHVPLFISRNITEHVELLKERGFSIIVTRPELATDASLRSDAPTAEKRCVIFGNEARGTSPELDRLADSNLSIPKYGAAESLNVAVSFGIVLHDLRKASEQSAA